MKNPWLILIVVCIVVELLLVLLLEMPEREQTLIKCITFIQALSALVFLCIQLSKNYLIKEAEFILQINKGFSDNDRIFGIYKKIKKSTENNSFEIPFTEDELIAVTEYLGFFETIAQLSHANVSLKELNTLFSFRFFVAVNNKEVQDRVLIPYAQFYGKIFFLYHNWLKYKNECGAAEPFSSTSLKKNFPKYTDFFPADQNGFLAKEFYNFKSMFV